MIDDTDNDTEFPDPPGKYLKDSLSDGLRWPGLHTLTSTMVPHSMSLDATLHLKVRQVSIEL